jgi:hypothetical protein
MKISKKELNKIFIQERKRLDREYRRMFKRVAKNNPSALNEAYRPQNIHGGPPYRQNPDRGSGTPTDMLSRYSEGDEDSEEALRTKDPADGPDVVADDLTDAYTIGPYGIIATEGLRRVILQEIEMMNEGIFDYFTKRAAPRDPWTDATGMQHQSLATPAIEELEMASHIFAKFLVEQINQMQGGWHNVPTSRGMMQDYEPDGWMDIGREFWPQTVRRVGETPVDGGVPYGTASMADAVLADWESDGILVRRKPDSAIGTVGPWLSYRGWVTLEDLARRSREAGI